MTRRLRLVLAPVAAAALVALTLTACATDDRITVQAIFDDVIDLVPRGHVRAGDIAIGRISAVDLTDDFRALVTMTVRRDSGLPSEVEAILLQTAVLGERVVELRPVGDTGALQDGTLIEDGKVLGDIEDLVVSGNELLAFVAADRLAAAVETGAVAFGGRGTVLGTFLDELGVFVGSFDDGRGDLVRLIDSLDALMAGLAPAADSNAEALAVLARSSEAFEQEDERLLDALDDLRRLAAVGTRLMEDHRVETDNAIRRLRMVLQQVIRIDDALQNLLTWLPRHNLHVPGGIVNEHAQVWLDWIVCGMTDVPDDPARSCDPPNPGQANEPPPFYDPEDHPCNDDHDHCEGEQMVGPR